MKKCLIWGTGGVFHDNITAIQFHEAKGTIRVEGVTSKNGIYENYYGYPYLDGNVIKSSDYDIVFVAAENDVYGEIVSEALSLGWQRNQILRVEILHHYEIDLERYQSIVENPPTIFANNCWGGLTYHSLGLEFTSPLINMFERDEDYIRFLQRPEYYMEQRIKYVRQERKDGADEYFPVCALGDVELYCNHYSNYEEVKCVWDRRIRRIRWEQLFVMMSTEDIGIATEFSCLPYRRKICFVPFETKLKDVKYVSLVEKPMLKDVPFWRIVMGMANGAYPYYDLYKLIRGDFEEAFNGEKS